jgi:uncharacterized protein
MKKIWRKTKETAVIAVMIFATIGCKKPDDEVNVKDEFSSQYDLTSENIVSFDGISLSTFVIKQKGMAQKAPVILIRTPYKIWDDEIAERKPFIEGFLSAGYVVVVQNERGRHGSTGRYLETIPFAKEDGTATLDWIVRQPWSTGRVGTFGCSSSAENQMALAQARHPAHVAMVPMSVAVALTEASNISVREPGVSRRGGVFWLGSWVSWFYWFGKLDSEGNPPVRDPYPGKLLSDNWPDEARGFPQIDMLKRLGVTPTEFETYIERPITDPEWSKSRVSDSDDIAIPALWMTSWFDYSPQLEIGVFEANRQRSEARNENHHKMIVASGLHCQQNLETAKYQVGERMVGDARLDYVRRTVDWFDAYVKEDPAAKLKVAAMSALTTYDAGLQKWTTARNWPIAQKRQEYCFVNRQANSLALGACAQNSDAVTLTHDPFNPVPTTGGGGYPGELGEKYPLGSVLQERLSQRSDVKTFWLPDLTENIEVFGNVNAAIWVSSDQPDADIFVKLVEMLPNGDIYNAADSALRQRYRNGYGSETFLSAGVPAQITTPTMVVRHTFKKGSKIGLQISSSNWPHFSINGSTKNSPELERNPKQANVKIWTGVKYPSRLFLPASDQPRARVNGQNR